MLAHTVDMRMNAEHEHSWAVADCAVSIATALGWQQDMLGMLRIAAILHDVGKVTVPDRILCKPGPLTLEEFELIKGHSIAGAELVPASRGSLRSFPGSVTPTRASTDLATPTACAGRQSRRRRGSCWSRTRSTR